MEAKIVAKNSTVEVDVVEWCRRLQNTVDHLHRRVAELEGAVWPDDAQNAVRVAKKATGED